MSQQIALWVRQRRDELGISCRDLETISGVSATTIRRIEQHPGTVALASVQAVVESLRGQLSADGRQAHENHSVTRSGAGGTV